MRKFLAIAAVLATTTAALSADLPSSYPPSNGPAAPVAFTWQGLYLGASGGYGWGTSYYSSDLNLKGPTAGGQIGFNAQWSMLVIGVEASGNWANITQTIGNPALVGATDTIKAYGTVHTRLGVAVDHFLIYSLGGVAFAQNQLSVSLFNNTASDTQTHMGFVIGGGAEYAMTNNLIIRGEYQYADFGSQNYFNNNIASGKVQVSTVKVGLNYLIH
jgi:outer membrane immunogenic protein